MKVGIGLPALPNHERPDLFLEWARAAETCGFSSLAVIDRIVFDNYDPLIGLAAVAAATSRIRLITAILISPYRTNTALLAKEIASLDRLSGGRLTVGIGIGARDDDYTASGLAPRGRARLLERQIDELRRIWRGELRGYAGRIGPPPTGDDGPPLLIAGHVDAALTRAGRLGDGWIMGGGRPQEFKQMATKVEVAWTAHRRHGRPMKAAIAYFCLGENAVAEVERYTQRYYDFPPDPGDQALITAAGVDTLAQAMALVTATTPESLRSQVTEWDAARCDELILLPCALDPEQVYLLADAVF